MTDDKNEITCTRTQCSACLASTDIRPTSVYARIGLLVPVLVYRSPRLAASLASCQHRTDGTTHVARQIDGDSGWGGGVRLASARAAAAAASKATKPRASDTTGRVWPIY